MGISSEGLQVGGKQTRKTREVREGLTKKPRVLLPLEARQELTDGKRILAQALLQHGVPQLVEIIKGGPKGTHEPLVNEEGNADDRLNLERWKWAMTFAGDRAGMPRISEIDLTNSEGLPPIEVRLKGFAKPAE